MRGHPWIPFWVFVLASLAASPAAAVVADRIMAVVNNDVIALSDVQEYREVFEQDRRADDAAVLKKLIDQKLLLAEAKKLEIPPPTEDPVKAAFVTLRQRFGRPETFELLKARLALTDSDIEQELRQQLHIEQLIEQRIHFFVFVRPEEIEAYDQEHAEEFKNQTPENARKAIQDILIAEKAKTKLEDYLERLRAKANIRINRPPPE